MLPERINVMKVITYDPSLYVTEIADMLSIPEDEVTVDMVLEDWMREDFNDNMSGIIIQDQDGNDL